MRADGFTCDEVLVEQAHDDPHVGVEMADQQGGRDIDQVIVGHDQDAARLDDAGLFEHVPVAAIAADEMRLPESGVLGIAARVDDRHRQPGGLQILQDAPADAPETTEDEGPFHAGIVQQGLGFRPAVGKEERGIESRAI